MIGDYRIRDITSFGDIAAEDDAVLDYFLSTDTVDRIRGNQTFLVLGRKGTGKTAIVRYLTEGQNNPTSKSLNLRNYPWAVHSKKIDYGSSDIEAYVSSWRYLIAVECASIILAHPRSHTTYLSSNLQSFMTENYGGPHPSLSDILRPKKLRFSKASFIPAIMGNQLGSVELERKPKDFDFGLEISAVSTGLFQSVIEVARAIDVKDISLHFDELDQGLSQLDESRKKMLTGLIIAARELRRDYKDAACFINPVIYLRSDIWDELKFSDKNKISQNSAIVINWDSKDLVALTDARIKARLDEKACWDDIATSDMMRGSQSKWNHILTRTFLRPRDVIQFLNELREVALGRDQDAFAFSNPDIVSARTPYSNYFKAELDDEIVPHWPKWEEALQAVTAIGLPNFTRSEFIKQYEARRSPSNQMDAAEALEQLYRFSIIGYERRSGYGGKSWAFKYIDPATGWDSAANFFKVHSGLKEYAKLRESRS